MWNSHTVTACAQVVTFCSTSSDAGRCEPLLEHNGRALTYGESRVIDETPELCCRVMFGVPR
jgi:hypothetical protein